MTAIINILGSSWDMFLDSSIYMLFGLLCAGFIHAYSKTEMIGRYLGKGRVRPVLLSALIGIPIPLCSCGVVPAAAGLKKQGANNGATLAFLISTPETGVDSIPLTYALMDPLMAIMRPVAAFISAVTAGLIENFVGKPEVSNELPLSSTQGLYCGKTSSFSGEKPGFIKSSKIYGGLKYAFIDLLGDIGKWFVIGLLISGLISYLMPENMIDTYLGNDFLAMFVMLITGIPMYICATSSTPIAAALVLKGLNPGAALVFLLAGPATNIASLSMVYKMLGKKALLIYLFSISVCALVFGFLTDFLYKGLNISAKASIGKTAELIPLQAEIIAAIIFTILLVNAIIREYRTPDACTKELVIQDSRVQGFK
ncbi:MAG: SO_0444 family Cu/Zn efflux transporter [Desulfobacterales bacterium]|nr:SO_0444 family Cu/Zn efflux transporter [Desulfobacterales bacterium]